MLQSCATRVSISRFSNTRVFQESPATRLPTRLAFTSFADWSERFPAQVEIYWEWFESENRLAETWPRFMPLLEEDAQVEANVPYRQWLDAARGARSELSWLIERFDGLPVSDKEKAELYDSQQILRTLDTAFFLDTHGITQPEAKHLLSPIVHSSNAATCD